MDDDVDEPKPSSHEKTILLTESDHKSSSILDDKKTDATKEDQDQHVQTTTECVEEKEEEQISFNFSPPDEQTVSISAEMRKSLAQQEGKF